MYSIALIEYKFAKHQVVKVMDYIIKSPPQRSKLHPANVRNPESAHSSVMGVLLLITIVMVMGGIVTLVFTSQPIPEKVPMAYLGIAKSADGVELVNKAGDTLDRSTVTILVDGVDRTAEFQSNANTPGWGTLKPGERISYKSQIQPESVQIVYASNSGQYLLASSGSPVNTPTSILPSPTIQSQPVQIMSQEGLPHAEFTSNITNGKSPLFVQFTDQSTGAAPLTYHWDFSDGAGNLPENSQQHPVWRFWDNVATSYTVTLTVTNAYGSDTIVKQNYIVLGDTPVKTPVAAFTSNVTNGTAPLTVHFTDQSASTGTTTYAWDINNDSKTDYSTKNTSHTYTAAGNYTVKLAVINASGNNTLVRTNYIRVTPPVTRGLPTARFTAGTTSGNAPLTVQFTDQSVSTGTTTYAWDINNDGKTDYSTKNTSHTYTTAGNYTVKLAVTNASGNNTLVKTNYIRVTPAAPTGNAPKAQFISNITQGTSPLFVQFTDQSTGTAPLTYQWDFSDGAGNLPENSQQNPTWRFWDNVASSYTVKLTVTNAYGSDTIVKQNYITLGDAPVKTPVAAFTSSITNGKAPLTVQFTDQSASTGTTTYAWDINNDGVTDYTIKSPSHTFTAAGTYTIKLTVSNASGSNSLVKSNYIQVTAPTTAALPTARFTASPTSGKAPLTVQFTDQSVSTGTSTYAWDINNDGKTDYTSKNPWITLATAGTYTVKLTVSNASGSNSLVKSNYIQVTAPTTAVLPTARFTASTTSGNAPLTVQFTDQSVSTGTTTYAWDINNDGVTDYTTKSPSHTFTAAGTYTVKLAVTNASGSNSLVKSNYISVVDLQTGECFGAESCNPTGNPIGGGAGYNRIISETDSRVKYVVSTASQLITALRSAKSGEVVFIKGNAVIDMTSNPKITIPAGVTVASDRGLNGSNGALLKRTRNVNGGWGEEIFIAGGNNVRVTGLRLEGEMYPQDYGNKAGETYENQYLVGIYAKERTGFEVDNCELRGFAWAAVASDNCVQSYVHHNYIHHNQARGEGYGVALYGGTSIVEANIFDYNRHAITGTGYSGEGYEARYNIILGNGNPIGGHHFDVHQDERGGSFAGNLYKIHHNTFKDGNGKLASIAIRQRPTTGMYIDHNLFETISNATNGGVPIWERDSTQNMFATNNKWMGKLYTSNSGIVWFV